jgi:exopolyphosphatase/guanosine-5'-triphosphate,3'-diphosphate pyrophosphatase
MTPKSQEAELAIEGVSPLRVIAAFDIGSNSIKMSLARQTPEGAVEEFLWRVETTRLGAGIDDTGQLADDRIEASVAAIARFADEAKRYGATRFIAVATEAVRIAANGQAFLDRLRADLGIEIETISGEREAELTFAGLDASIDRAGTWIVADIGGASTEVIEARDDAVVQSASLQIGSGRLTDRYVVADPPLATELDAAREAARDVLTTHSWSSGCDRLVITGGTAEYAKRLLDHDWPAYPAEIEAMLGRLTAIRSTDLAPMIDASVLRARVLPAGIAVVAALIDLTVPDEILGAASGIRTGLLHAAFRGEL